MLHILPNVARSKVNQTMKFRVNRIFFMRNIFVEKSYAEGAEGSPRDQNREYLWINNLNCYKFVYVVCPGEDVSKYFNPISTLEG